MYSFLSSKLFLFGFFICRWLKQDKDLDEHKYILLLIKIKMEYMLMKPQKKYVQVSS
ncbi:hypothetical protein RDI58_020256 [Solanum bulbocastanum]|uniref:Uncharacterized protein n=1 Tax=Solanum bulbocastanum TaxID=147425 RepID=A0AAN8T8E3_SOLBU